MSASASACVEERHRHSPETRWSLLRAWAEALAGAYAMARNLKQARRLCDAELKRRGLSRATLAAALWRACQRTHLFSQARD